MPSEIRMKRIQDQMKRVLTEILETRVHDPRVQSAYITDVSVDRELDYANIYVSSLEGEDIAEELLAGLRKASGFIRYTLSQEIELRTMPKLRFYWDETPDRVDRIEALLAEIRESHEGAKEESTPSRPESIESNDDEQP